MRSVEFHLKAQAELISAARFFEGKSVNLGLTFIRTVLVRDVERDACRVGARVVR